MRPSKRVLVSLAIVVPTLAALVVALVIGFSATGVRAASGGSPASDWHIGYFYGNGLGAANAAAPSVAGGVASLHFTNLPNTILLVTDNKAKFPTLLGDLTGKSVSASVTVSGLSTSASFGYYGGFCGSSTSYVRIYFKTSNAGGFQETQYWWSHAAHLDLTGNETATLTTSFGDAPDWSDVYGHYASDPGYAAGFQAAVSHVTEIGLSFGGGCFYENGVGTSDGSGTFTLNSFAVA